MDQREGHWRALADLDGRAHLAQSRRGSMASTWASASSARRRMRRPHTHARPTRIHRAAQPRALTAQGHDSLARPHVEGAKTPSCRAGNSITAGATTRAMRSNVAARARCPWGSDRLAHLQRVERDVAHHLVHVADERACRQPCAAGTLTKLCTGVRAISDVAANAPLPMSSTRPCRPGASPQGATTVARRLVEGALSPKQSPTVPRRWSASDVYQSGV